ncbi:MAG: type III-B CRISPR-associated protein Cas10/Cmr2 [Verrucomicrobiales bacterium]|nr:type III-B CRISPR-associated protein Cas10/Cmr2 [Verrucomicrobiales bacterium]
MTTDPANLFWKRKLAAFLHDPPHKPYRIAGHEDARESFWHEAHLSKDEFLRLIHRPDDHLAAAADRMIFPDWKKSGVRTDWKTDADCAFHHPLGGGKLVPKEFPRTAEAAEGMIAQSLQGVGIADDMPDAQRWWRLWREWPENCARKHGHFAYLAADTRVPHHTLWQHNGLVSALSTCDAGCSFLLFQIGPVQEFIKQARSTRDLWAGSYLLSFLISRALFAVAKAVGPESVIYPQLRGVPLIDWFGHCAEGQFWCEEKRAAYKFDGVREELLTPNLPNRFLALVPKDWRSADGKSIAQVAEEAVLQSWREIANTVHDAIHSRLGVDFPGWDQFWSDQTSRFPVVDYYLHDWQDTATVLAEAETGTPPLHGGWENHPLRNAIEWAIRKIDPQHFDTRCYKHKSWQEGGSWKNQLLNKEGKPLAEGEAPVIENQGFVWALHYAATEWKFAAAKNARGFPQWNTTLGVEKDHLDGRNEVLGGARHDAFWQAMREANWGEHAIGKVFKGQQEYGALTTIKRLYPFLWLPQKLDTKAPRFESVIDIALENENDQSTYYAILCMDGDDMGQWVGGTRTPFWKEVLSGKADDEKTPLGYFAKHWGAGWETIRTPLTPAFHAALSESLGNFSLYCARQIVEAFDGELIYSGGDDVLAMLPADQAIDCADALQLVFRGIDPAKDGRASVKVQEVLRNLFEFAAPGFVRCREGSGKGEHTRPNWPLMVPGPAVTASVGIAIGHVRSPMQDVIQAAREAEHAAKAVPQKGALALRVLKRSGESVQFAARFDSGLPGVWAELVACRAQLSSRFIHRFLRKLQPCLATVKHGRTSWEPSWQVGEVDLRQIALAELAQSILAQSDLHKEQKSTRPARCREHAGRWMEILAQLSPENFLHFWMARAFLNRLAEPQD